MRVIEHPPKRRDLGGGALSRCRANSAPLPLKAVFQTAGSVFAPITGKLDSYEKATFLLTFALGTGAAQAQVKFETKSTDAVREMAIKQGKLVFIDLYASWCPPCRMMERQVFSRKDVGEFMDQRFVAAKYDTDKTTGRELMKKYGSGAIPLYLVFDTRGELLGRIQGAADAETFMDNLRTIIARQKPHKQQP